jgi:hypothetical protein
MRPRFIHFRRGLCTESSIVANLNAILNCFTWVADYSPVAYNFWSPGGVNLKVNGFPFACIQVFGIQWWHTKWAEQDWNAVSIDLKLRSLSHSSAFPLFSDVSPRGTPWLHLSIYLPIYCIESWEPTDSDVALFRWNDRSCLVRENRRANFQIMSLHLQIYTTLSENVLYDKAPSRREIFNWNIPVEGR